MPVVLFGVGKTALHRFTMLAVNPFAFVAEPHLISFIDTIAVNVPGHHFGRVPAMRALAAFRASLASGFLRCVTAITFA